MRREVVWVLGRLIIGGVFFFSGLQKLTQPYENFLYVIENYQILPSEALASGLALVLPWAELGAGAFLLAGLWTPAAVAACGAMTLSFIIVVGQALVRRLPLDSCGCFGDLLKVPPYITFGLDILMGAVLIGLWRRRGRIRFWSLDRWLLP